MNHTICSSNSNFIGIIMGIVYSMKERLHEAIRAKGGNTRLLPLSLFAIVTLPLFAKIKLIYLAKFLLNLNLY